MKKILIFIILFLFAPHYFSQEKAEKDSVEQVICNRIKAEKISEMGALQVLIMDEFSKYYQQHPDLYNEQKVNDWQSLIGENCIEILHIFTQYSRDNEKTKYYFQESKPEQMLSQKRCNKIFKNWTGYYKDPSGQNIQITLKENYYIEYLPDNTFSKLEFTNLGNCEFRLVFKESNNKYKKDLNRKIDVSKSVYRLASETESKYNLVVKNPRSKYYQISVIDKFPIKD